MGWVGHTAGGNGGKIEGKAKHVVGAVGHWDAHQIRCSQEQDSESAVAIGVGLPCFCSQGDGMWHPLPLNKFPDSVCSKCSSN